MMDFFEFMSRNTGAGILKRYRIVRGWKVLSGCLYCQGALFKYGSSVEGEMIFKCFHCGRMFLNYNGNIKLWPYKEYEHLKNRYQVHPAQ